IVANSNFTRNKLIALGCNAEKIEILPVIPNLDIFNAINKITERNSSTLNILTIARLVEKKGVEYGVKAINTLNKYKDLDIRYNIIGNGPLSGYLQNLINQLGLEEKVFLHGAKTQDEI